MKVESLLSEEDFVRQVDWPDGNYCVYKVSDMCPDGESLTELDVHYTYKYMSLFANIARGFIILIYTMTCILLRAPHNNVVNLY